MVTGMFAAHKRNKNQSVILREVRDMIEVEKYKEVIPKLNKVLKEYEKFKDGYECMLQEFNRKKIGRVRFIADKDKIKPCDDGVLYFNKIHIGKKVIVWQKD